MRRAASHAAFAAAFVMALLVAGSGTGQAASLLEKNFWLEGPRYHANLPGCETPAALNKIATQFGEKEGKFWNSSLRIVEFLRVSEVAIRPWAEDTIPRRFCRGTVVISSGKRHQVHYSIIEDGGPIGATWGVEWCVVGLDRNWAYNPGCRMAQP